MIQACSAEVGGDVFSIAGESLDSSIDGTAMCNDADFTLLTNSTFTRGARTPDTNTPATGHALALLSAPVVTHRTPVTWPSLLSKPRGWVSQWVSGPTKTRQFSAMKSYQTRMKYKFENGCKH